MSAATSLWLVPLATTVVLAAGMLLGDVLLALFRIRSRMLLIRMAAGGGVGLIVLIAVTALFLSVGWSSVFGLSLLLVLAAAAAKRQVIGTQKVRLWAGSVGAASLVAAAYSLWLAGWLTDGQAELVRAPFQRDSPNYVMLTAFLERFGVETLNPHFLDGIGWIPSPYHYTDAWLAVGVGRFFPIGHALAYMAVVQSLLATLLVLAVGALVHRASRASVWISLACACIAFFPGVEPIARLVSDLSRGRAFEKVGGDIHSYVMSPMLVNKLLPAALLLVFALLAFAHRRSRASAPWLLAAIPLAYVTFAPFVGVALGALAVSLLLKRSWAAARQTIFALGACVLLVPLGFTGASSLLETLFEPRGALAGPALSEVVGGAFRVTAGGTARLLLLLLVPASVVALLLKGSVRLRWIWRLWWPPLLGLAGSVLAWAVLHRSMDSWQLLTTPSACVLAGLHSVVLGLVLSRLGFVAGARGGLLSGAVALVLVALAAGWTQSQFLSLARQADAQTSESFRKRAKERVGHRAELKGIGVWIRGSESFRDIWDYSLSASIHPLAFLFSDEPYTVAIPLGRLPLADGLTGERQRALLSRAPFYRATGLANSAEITEQQVESFLSKQRVSYVLLDPGVVVVGPLEKRLDGCQADELSGTQLCLWRSEPAD